MPNSPHEPSESLDGLRAYLGDVLPGSRLTNTAADGAYQPLLLLETKHVMAGFAFSNGDLSKSYNALYTSFKKCYAGQRGAWDALDLAFVFCVRPDIPNLDRFCSQIETDVYFCRKFVVPLASPLNDSLARLPFLPLTPLHGQSLRPPSAQTFLQQCGVPPALAKSLVVQRERSAEGIVDDCTGGTFGEPRELTPVLNSRVARNDRSHAPVRFESIEVKDFRAYRKSQLFRLGTDVTVLYGPNGFGKTSFFDAVDFVVTGEIGRLKPLGASHFKHTAKHLDARAEESVVSLLFSSNGVLRRITRKVSDPKQAQLDGRLSDRKTILTELTGGDLPAADRVENFVSLFRATHLFSQEHQELAKDFRNDCELSGPIVSRLLAFEDYANAVNKATKVKELVQAAIAHAEDEVRDLSEQISDQKEELDRLGRSAQAHGSADVLDAVIDSLRSKVGKAGIAVHPEARDAATVRGWRASLDTLHAESQRRVARLSVLARESGRLPATRAALARSREQLSVKEQALVSVDQDRNAAERDLQLAEQQLAEAVSKRTQAQAQAERLAWIRSKRPVYAELLKRQREVTRELNQAIAGLGDSRESAEKTESELRAIEEYAERASRCLETGRRDLTTLAVLNESAASWKKNRDQLAAVLDAEKRLQTSLNLLRVDAEALSSQLGGGADEETRLSRFIGEVDRGQSALRNLVSQLQTHVRNGTCPLCGEDHGSKDQLLRRIQEHVAADAASGARADLAELREKAAQLSERMALNKQAQDTAGASLATLTLERATLTKDIDDFESAVASLGVTIEPTGQSTQQQLQERHDRIQREVTDFERQARDSAGELQIARTASANIRATIESQVADITAKEGSLFDIQAQVSRLREDPHAAGIGLDLKPRQLVETERLNSNELGVLDADITTTEGTVAQVRPRVSALLHEERALTVELQRLRDQCSSSQKTLTEIVARLEEAELSADASEESVLALIADESRAQSQFGELRDSAASIELAIDTATTAAALTSLRQNVVNKERIVASAQRKREEHRPWLKYFDALSGLVAAQQNEAIDQFTREYGPRTSVIQRRLRSVYGFDEVEIHSQKSTIRVRVMRRGEELKPTDYFSQSQQQTLLLGLFLTACLSQTWSSLSPVFLDDPVSHFDDLNTYAFLDLLVGLLESESGHRQFIISTCDEKFFQLARQKFRHLGERSKFYTFSAIGSDGPVVEEIGASMVNGSNSTS